MENGKALPELSAAEQRVLGSLIEKSKTTPDYYPLTLNSLVSACNQKSSRYPVTDYSEEEVQIALNSLKGISLASIAVGGGSRVLKYKHNITTLYTLNDAELAILCLLLLRGPLTAGEINSNAGRLYTFSSLASVLEHLESLAHRSVPFVQLGEKKAGQKEARYRHLLGSPPEAQMETAHRTEEQANDLLSRVEYLEMEVERLKQIIDTLNNSRK